MANYTMVAHDKIVLDTVHENCARAMEKAGEMLVEAVQEKMLYGYHTPHGKPPHTEIVDTEVLFDSIQSRSGQESDTSFAVIVGTDVSYARYVHDGTYKLEGRPYIRDGFMASVEKIRSLFESELGE